MAVTALEGASDDDVHVLPRHGGEGFVEVEIVAGQEPVADSVDLDHRRRGEFFGILMSDSGIQLQRRNVAFVIFSDPLTVTADGDGGIPVFAVRFHEGIDKHNRLTADSGFRAFPHQGIRVLSVIGEDFLTGIGGTGHIAVFRQNDHVHGVVQGIKEIHLEVIAGIAAASVPGVWRLNDGIFHWFGSFAVFFFIISEGKENCNCFCIAILTVIWYNKRKTADAGKEIL